MIKNDIKKFSVLTATYKREKLMCNKIEYYQSLAVAGVEVIICNDDPEMSILDEAYSSLPNIRYLKNTINCGLPATRNRLIDAATREYVLICDDDDFVNIQSLCHLNDLISSVDCVCIWGGKTVRKVIKQEKFLSLVEIFRSGLAPPVAAQCFKRSFLEEHKLRYRSVPLGVDHDLYIQMIRLNPKIYFDKSYLPITANNPRGRLTTKAEQLRKIEITLEIWRPEIENSLGVAFYKNFKKKYIAYVKSREFIASLKVLRPKLYLLDGYTFRSVIRKTMSYFGKSFSELG